MHRSRIPFARRGAGPASRRPPLRARVALLAALAVAGWALLGLAGLGGLGGLGGCKKESEPDWPYGPPPGGLPDVGAPVPLAADVSGPSPEDGPAPDAGGAPSADGVGPAADATPADATPIDAVPSGDVPPGTVALSEETLVALRRPVSAADREAAERETEAGRALHARLQLREALGHYRLALQRMPAHAPANYLAARALALLGRPPEALHHLLVLDALATDPARELLAQARGERDFRSLWPDETFRRLTGFGTIGVAVLPGGGAPSNDAVGAVRDDLLERLSEAGLPAVAADAPADAGQAPVVFHRPEHALLADNVARALDGLPLRPTATLPQDVLVVWKAGDPLPASPAVPLDDLLDHPLQARDGYGLRTFRLRSTGYFESEDRAADGSEVRRRRGRWRAEADQLVLVFKEVLERYPEGAEVPEIETTEATRTVPFSVGPGRQVVIDGLAYRPK